MTAIETHLVEKPVIFEVRTHVEVVYFWAVHASLYGDRSVYLYIFYRSMDSYISKPSVNPNISEPSIDPCILSGPWIPIFWVVHGSLFSGRSIVSFILIGPWIPFFPKNVLSRQNPDSSPDSVRTKFVFIFQNCPDWIQIFFWKLSGPDKIQIWIWTQSGHFFKIKIKFVQIESRFKSGFCLDQTVSRKKSGQENQIIWTRFESGRILPTSVPGYRPRRCCSVLKRLILNWKEKSKKLKLMPSLIYMPFRVKLVFWRKPEFTKSTPI